MVKIIADNTQAEASTASDAMHLKTVLDQTYPENFPDGLQDALKEKLGGTFQGTISVFQLKSDKGSDIYYVLAVNKNGGQTPYTYNPSDRGLTNGVLGKTQNLIYAFIWKEAEAEKAAQEKQSAKRDRKLDKKEQDKNLPSDERGWLNRLSNKITQGASNLSGNGTSKNKNPKAQDVDTSDVIKIASVPYPFKD